MSINDGEQAVDVEIAGEYFSAVQARLDDGDFSCLFQSGQVKAHGEGIFANGLSSLLEGDEDAGHTFHRAAAEELQSENGFSGAWAAADKGGSA